MTSKLREFIAKTQSDRTSSQQQINHEHNTAISQLDSINWQLKRIADALEQLTGGK